MQNIYAPFVRSGRVYLYSGYLNYAGIIGSGWSNTAPSSTSNAYYFNFDSNIVKTSSADGRFSGFSLRCLQE